MSMNQLVEQYSTPKRTVRARLFNEVVSPAFSIKEDIGPVSIDQWLEDNYYVDRPRDMTNAAILPPGPIRLADYQKRVIREAMRRDGDGKYIYSTVLWSEPKKSGKTAIAGGIALNIANRVPAARIYCLANDGKQSKDRIFDAISRNIKLHKRHGGLFENCRDPIYSPPMIRLPNEAIIEAIPCDAAGEAGGEPTLTVWSEMWGFQQKHKERLWTEMTIPPTLYGYAMRWVESYAGYEDESTTLRTLYNVGVEGGERHPDFPDLPVYVNHAAHQLSFWSEEPRMPWQTEDYYAAEALMLTPNEFSRIHRNQWVVAVTSLFQDDSFWNKCMDRKAARPLEDGDMTPMVVAIDAAVSGDCCAIVGVSRHPDDKWDAETRRVIERYVGVWYPPKGGKINYTYTIQPAIKMLAENYNVYAFVYDPYQLHKMCTDLRVEGVGNFQEFSQHGRRLAADKQFYDMVVHRQYIHSGHPVTLEHIRNTAQKPEGRHLRFIKKANNRPIDLTVAASMSVDECLRLNI